MGLFSERAVGTARPVSPRSHRLDAAPAKLHALTGPRAQARLHELDGLRGWAALGVMLFHVYWECFGRLFPEFRHPVVGVLVNGHLAVCIFFVISGAALGAPFFSRGGTEGRRYLLRSALKRYPRLAIPVAVFALAYLGLARAGLIQGAEAAAILQREDWLLTAPQSPGAIEMLVYMIRDVFTGAPPNGDFLPFLWTMPVEMMGSMLLFLVLALFDGSFARASYLPLLALLAMPLSPYMSAFLIGAEFSRRRIETPDADPGRLPLAVLAAAVAGAAVFSTLALPYELRVMVDATLAAMVVYACMNLPGLRGALGGWRVSRFLGRISFTLYIVHFHVIMTLMSWLVIRYQDALTLGTASAIATVTVAVSLALAWIFAPIDGAAHRISGRMARWILGKLWAGVAIPAPPRAGPTAAPPARAPGA